MPGEKVRRHPSHSYNTTKATKKCRPRVVEVISESEPMRDEVTLPQLGASEKLRYAKWKIQMAYAYLAFTCVICVGAVVINPTVDVRLVVLAWGGSTSGALALLLRREYKQTI